MLAPSSRKELSEQCFLGGPLRDHFLTDFLVLFQGGPDTKNRALAQARAQFSLFREVRFFFDFGLHFGAILGPKFATILVFGGPKGLQEGVRKKHEKKKAFWLICTEKKEGSVARGLPSGALVKHHILRKAYKNIWENDTLARQHKQGLARV